MEHAHLSKTSIEQLIEKAVTQILLKLCVDAFGNRLTTAVLPKDEQPQGKLQHLAYAYTEAWPLDLSRATCHEDIAEKLPYASSAIAWNLFLTLHKAIWMLGGWQTGSCFPHGIDLRVVIDMPAKTYKATVTAWYGCSYDALCESQRRMQNVRFNVDTGMADFPDYVPPRTPPGLSK